MTSTVTDYRSRPNTSPGSLGHVPGKKGMPILGMTPALYRDFFGTINKFQQRYGPVAKIGIGTAEKDLSKAWPVCLPHTPSGRRKSFIEQTRSVGIEHLEELHEVVGVADLLQGFLHFLVGRHELFQRHAPGSGI